MQGQRIVFPAPGEAQVEGFQVDEASPGHVLLRAEASVISPGTEGAAFTGRQNMNTMTYPQRPGYAWVGRVIQVGAEAGGAKLGDRVLVMKPHASHATVCPTTEV